MKINKPVLKSTNPNTSRTLLEQITINSKDKSVRGAVSYWFNVLKATDTIKIDAQNMDFSDAELNQKKVQFTTDTCDHSDSKTSKKCCIFHAKQEKHFDE